MELTLGAGEGAGERIEVTGDRLVIGRDADCDIRLDDTKVSRRHAEIVRVGDHFEVRDLDSSNGTYVGDVRLTGARRLADGDVVRIGRQRVTVSLNGALVTELDRPARTERSRTRLTGATTMLRDLSRRTRLVAIGAVGVGVVAIAVAVLALTGAFSKDEPTVADAAKAVAPSTVQVLGDQGDALVTGTGWVLDASRGWIVTNEHVIDALSNLRVAFGGRTQPARIAAVAYCDDLALLQVAHPAGMRSIRRLPRQDMLTAGQPVVTVGYPGTFSAHSPLVTDAGVVSVVRTAADSPEFTGRGLATPYPNLIQTDAAINHGNSGGPLVDLQGRLVGVNTLTGSAIEDLQEAAKGKAAIANQQNYAIGIDRVNQLLPLLTHGQSRGFTGAFLDFTYKWPRVSAVVSGSPADHAGLAVGDLINGVDGRAVPSGGLSPGGWCRQVGDRTTGSSTRLGVVHRDGSGDLVTVSF